MKNRKVIARASICFAVVSITVALCFGHAKADDDASTLPPSAVVGTETLNVRPGEALSLNGNPTQKSSVDVGNGRIETISVPVVSWRDLPFQTVKRQALDYSCGSAAVATLLTYVYGKSVSEEQVFNTMFEHGDKEKIRREGFSLLDMSRYLNSLGLKTKGYKLDLDSIEKHKVPFIALINQDGYNHFVVVKSLQGPFVLVGDPSKGNVVYSKAQFAKMWNGLSLVVVNQAQRAHEAFADKKEWKYARASAMASVANDFVNDSVALPFIGWQIAPSGMDLAKITVTDTIESITNSTGNSF